MGQAKANRNLRRALAARGEAVPEPLRPVKVRVLELSVDAETLRQEYEAWKARSGYDLSEHGYAEALLQAALERERATRERLEEVERNRGNLIQPATHVPPEMAAAAARLEALKAGR